jgi:hypothetical protein
MAPSPSGGRGPGVRVRRQFLNYSGYAGSLRSYFSTA